MKRIIVIIAIAVMAASCSITRDRQVFTSFIDYRPYTEKGFFISPNPYTGEFASIGELSIIVTPGINTVSKVSVKSDKDFSDGVYSRGSSSSSFVEDIPASELVEMAVKEAQKVGANGIANFKCLTVYNTVVSKSGVSRGGVSHYEISGLCISIQ